MRLVFLDTSEKFFIDSLFYNLSHQLIYVPWLLNAELFTNIIKKLHTVKMHILLSLVELLLRELHK